MKKIDFVVLWVDESDEKWLKKKTKYVQNQTDEYEAVRYRDWGTLKYLLRSIEQYAPWVHKVYLITDDQVPGWLNCNCEKLKIVNHRSFIPEEYLPTFNSNAIELNVHRIKELSKQFVFFNDDFVLTKPCKPSDFFDEGLPVDEATLNGINGKDELFAGIQFHNMAVMNQYYSTLTCRKMWKMWLCPKYGLNVIRTLLLLPFKRIQGIYNPHGPMPVLKATCEKLWRRDAKVLDHTCRCKTRTADNVSIYLYRYEQLLTGKFIPRKSQNAYHTVADSEEAIMKSMKRNKSICLNDVMMDQVSYLVCKTKIENMLHKKFPNKSQFER